MMVLLLEKGAAGCQAHAAAGSGRRQAAAASPPLLALHAAPCLPPATSSLLVPDNLQQRRETARCACSPLAVNYRPLLPECPTLIHHAKLLPPIR